MISTFSSQLSHIQGERNPDGRPNFSPLFTNPNRLSLFFSPSDLTGGTGDLCPRRPFPTSDQTLLLISPVIASFLFLFGFSEASTSRPRSPLMPLAGIVVFPRHAVPTRPVPRLVKLGVLCRCSPILISPELFYWANFRQHPSLGDARPVVAHPPL